MHTASKAGTALALIFLSAGQAHAQFFQNSSGLNNPARVITFDEVVLTPQSPVIAQYAAYGLTFTGASYASGPPNVNSNISGHWLQNFVPFVPATNPFSINFSTHVTQAAFALSTPTGSTGIQALLNNVVVSDQTVSTNLTSTNNFFGFQGIAFNQIRISSNTAFDHTLEVDNIQFGQPNTAVPEPGTLSLLGLGLGGVVLTARRRRV